MARSEHSVSSIRVTVRIEKKDGAPHEAVNGHASGDALQIEELIESARRNALNLIHAEWLRKL